MKKTLDKQAICRAAKTAASKRLLISNCTMATKKHDLSDSFFNFARWPVLMKAEMHLAYV